MKRRHLLAAVVFSSPFVVLAVACSFPDVTFGPADGGSSPETSTGTSPETSVPVREAGSDAGADVAEVDAVADVVEIDVVEVDVATRDDGGAPVDASLCATKTKCDCDDDGYADKNCDVDASTLKSKDNVPLKPGDCDDLDPLRHPDQDYVDEVPAPGKDGDWNCDGQVETPDVNGLAWCTGNPLLGGCKGGPGFINATMDCGEKADLYTCSASGLTCKQTLATGQTQKKRCR